MEYFDLGISVANISRAGDISSTENKTKYSRLSNKRVVWNKCVGWNLTGNLINMLDGIIMLEGKF